ncbi:malonic semialdehyde reductase [Chitiniphilus purpureus]|uniref:Malonic semialdehyde reductase n=1 Tax=Chitiniphilus purpureus TaxID=2981137 RepID=A0ABY6DN86_9NEIS|nr:malonic semialdehyde reductase [Chitiniphilus sp. CD1]UXY15482.1 malonic semialdehyde reductase [Chitiniphilus sp. CD1]
MTAPLAPPALAQLFHAARTVQRFSPRPVDEATLHELYALVRQGPTGFNAQPGRYAFVRSAQAKALLAPALSSGNRDRTLAAPLTAIVAWDTRFHEQLPTLFPAFDARGYFDSHPDSLAPAGVTNATLQAGYLILAARALGLDAAPMSGFQPGLVDAAFFPDGRWRALLLINLGYGERAALPPRLPRLAFDDAVAVF